MNLLKGILLLLAFGGSALYSGLETGVVSANPLRVQHLRRLHKRGAATLHWFMENPDHLLGTTLAGTNLCNVVLSVTAAQWAVHRFGPSGYPLASVLVTLLLLVGGEYLPKAWFRSFPAYRVLPWTGFLKVSSYLFYPVNMALMRLARILLPVPANEAEQRNPFVTREELAFLAREGEKYGAFTPEESQRLSRVLALPQKVCADIMVPRREIITVRPEASRDEIIAHARQHTCSRLPIYDERTCRFTGLVNIMDLLLAPAVEPDRAQTYARPPQYMRTDTRIDHALTRMRLNRQPLALVRDATETVVGLLTIRDILEEIVGEF